MRLRLNQKKYTVLFIPRHPVLNYQPSANRPNKRVWWPVSPPNPCRTEISLETVFSNIILETLMSMSRVLVLILLCQVVWTIYSFGVPLAGLCFSALSPCTPLMLSVQVSFHIFLRFLLLVPPILYLMGLIQIPRSSRSSVGSLLIFLIP